MNLWTLSSFQLVAAAILIQLILLGSQADAKPIVSPFFKPKKGEKQVKQDLGVEDRTYFEFYGRGKKNEIARLSKNLSPKDLKLTKEALLKATSAQTTALVAAAEAAQSSLAITRLTKKAQAVAMKRAQWALRTVKVAAKAEEVAVKAIQTLFMH